MGSGLRSLGLVGAALIIVGVAVIGTGLLNEAIAESSEIGCEFHPPASGCTSEYDNALNASTNTEYFAGAGFIVAGVGLGLVLIAAVGFMSRWPPPPRAGFLPPSPPAPPFPPGAP